MGITQEVSVRYPSASPPQNSGVVTDSVIGNTADAVAKVLASIPLAVGQAVTVSAMFTARRDDGTAAAGRVVSGTWRRQAAGNVTLVGALVGATQTDGTTPVCNLVANTTTQTVDISVTGIAAQNWVWEVNFSSLKV
jgi:hypothetical protein